MYLLVSSSQSHLAGYNYLRSLLFLLEFQTATSDIARSMVVSQFSRPPGQVGAPDAMPPKWMAGPPASSSNLRPEHVKQVNRVGLSLRLSRRCCNPFICWNNWQDACDAIGDISQSRLLGIKPVMGILTVRSVRNTPSRQFRMDRPPWVLCYANQAFGWLERVSRHKTVMCLLVIVMTMAIRIALLPRIAIPQPYVADEFSSLLSGESCVKLV